MSFAVGIVGLPNVGKSTLFKALTKKQVDIANYPFCTIEPNVGTVEVPDTRLQQLATTSASAKVIATTIKFVDIAGLVKGASQGEGLGNQFLSHIREVDAIAQVVRSFTDDDITHVHGSLDPQRDAEIIETELMLADLTTVEKRLQSFEKKKHAGLNRDDQFALATVTRLCDSLTAGTPARKLELSPEERLAVRDLNLLTIKPLFYVVNVDEQISEPPVVFGDAPTIAVSAKIESELAELTTAEAQVYMTELGIKESGLDRLIRTAYKLLNLVTFFTSGPEESRAWTITADTTAADAAGVIHTDFKEKFIRAEVIDWQDFVDGGGEAGAKEKGKMRLEGRDYLMRDGDTCYFRIGA